MNSKDSDLDQEGLGKIDYKQGYLTLPFTQSQFKEFISGLFGKPEQLERRIEGNFEVELGDIKSFHYLIEDRIEQQNKGLLTQFSAKIFYNDNSSIVLNSFDSFSNYVEPRVLIPTTVELSWQYLIQFPNRNVPEKQEIELHITTRSRESLVWRGFRLIIKYTVRTWATDIDSLLSEHIKNLIRSPRDEDKWKEFIFRNHQTVGSVSGIVFFLLSVLGGFSATNKFIGSKLEKTAAFLSKSSDLDAKVDFLINYISGGEIARFYFFLTVFLLIMLVASIFLIASISAMAMRPSTQSYILLTERAKRKKEADLKTEKNQMKALFLSIIIGIFVNLLSSYIFMHLTAR